MKVTLGVPIVKSVCEVETSSGTHKCTLYFDLFFSKWALDLEDFVPLVVPERNRSDEGKNAFFKLEPMVKPEEFVDKLMSAYGRYADRVDDLRRMMVQVRKSYRFTIFLPVSTSQLEAEDRLVKEVGLIEGAARGINLLLGAQEWERILDLRIISTGEQLLLKDELELGTEVKYYRSGLGESKLLSDLITTNPYLLSYLTSLTH